MTTVGQSLVPTELRGWIERPDRRPRAVQSLPRAAWPALAAALVRTAETARRPVLLLTPNPERFLAELRPWLAGRPRAVLFSEVQVSFLDRPPAFDQAVSQRLDALAALAQVDPVLVVSSRRALQRVTMHPDDFRSAAVTLAPEQQADPVQLASRLVELGYSREPLAEAPGQFALRGGILDIFPSGASTPVRAEFFGDVVDTLRLYDPQNQRSIMGTPRVVVVPGREVLLGPDRGSAAVARMRGGDILDGLRVDVRDEWEEDLTKLEAGGAFPGVELFSAYLEPRLPSLLDHLPPGALILDLDRARQLATIREIEQETTMLAAAEARDGELPRAFPPPMVPLDRLQDLGENVLEVATEERPGGFELPFHDATPVVGQPEQIRLLGRQAEHAAIVLATEQRERAEALLQEAHVREVPAEVELDVDWEPEPGLWWHDRDLASGFTHSGAGLVVLSDAELFGRVRRAPGRVSRGPRPQPKVQLEFQPGELVVHVDHGVSRFLGMRLIDSEDEDGAAIQREYLELEYAEGDKLFVPVENLDRVQKYLGGGEGKPVLQRLGTGDWERARARAKRNAEDVAEDLLRIYAQREAKPGFAFSPDTVWQEELERRFPYEETPDQIRAITEIKADMESDRPMDRLLCGDVGFGKTEVALRAAFKAVMSGRQVALLAPTTILVQQHFQVFTERLAGLPVTVEVLSRFRTEDEQRRTLAGLKAGAVDIVIGTHMLLQKNVRFKRLGLLIVDEEQRFGVMQKESLKRLRTNLDVLSLSATPIPRSLHMAVSGIRDMSVVQTPPEDRQPIKTYVTADDDEVVREVIERELARGGQVYFLHNRVRTMPRAKKRLEELIPSARVIVGHGQMPENELAQVMVDFAAHRADVLCCTTIIENGLDIPNANTLVVDRAEHLGLSQLYQLRGRVGRSGKRAYCYFMYDPKRSLTEAADSRLDVMSGLHELGQGFKIALRDLEIRGAGNLLGTEQHGAIAAVGFEMYLQMLQQSVARLRSGQEEDAVRDVLQAPELQLDLPLDHFVPRSFIRDERLRLDAYRQLAAAEDEGELDQVLRSLRDRYGEPPKQLDNLVYSLRVKLLAQRLQLRGVVTDGHDVVLRVDPDRLLDTEQLERQFSGRLRVRPNRLLLRRQGEGWRAELVRLLEAMREQYDSATPEKTMESTRA
jgi:transcription-repair coupling factor (superfamily II helicase)